MPTHEAVGVEAADSTAGPMASATPSAGATITPQQQYYHSIGRSKEPAVVAAEKYMAFLLHYENTEEIMNALDPSIAFVSPMAYYRGRPVVKSWMQFEAKTMIPFQPYARLKEIKSEDEMKSATIRWSLGGLHFVDRIHLSHLLQYQTVHRTMTRAYKTLDEKLIAEEFLRLLTGPHFSAHCEPKEGSIDNTALVLPTLDYSHLGLRDFKQLLSTSPSTASTSRPVLDMNVVYHFMSEALVKAQMESEKQKEASEEKTRKANFSSKTRGEQFVIKATNREGEKKVLVIDKADFFRSNQASRVEQMQDDEVTGIATRHDRPRYLCSCVRLRNNFFGAREGEEFDADGKLLEKSEEDASANNGKAGSKVAASAAAAARLAGVGGFSSSSLAPAATGGKRGSSQGHKESAAAAAAGELGTVLKLLVMNAFYFVTNIDLSSNKLTILPDLSELPLVGLSLHDNRLSSWEDLEVKLKPLKLLQNLTLFANPIQKEATSVKEYKYSVLALFFEPEGRSIRDPPLGPLTRGGGGGLGGRKSPLLLTSSSNNNNTNSSAYNGLGSSVRSTSTAGKIPKTLNISSTYYANASGGGGGVGANNSNTNIAQTSAVLPPVQTRGHQDKSAVSAGGGNGAHRLSTVACGGASSLHAVAPTSSFSTSSSASHAAQAIITLRSLDHSVISPKEADIVKTFIKTFEAKHVRNVKLERRREEQQQSAAETISQEGQHQRLRGGGGGADEKLRNKDKNGANMSSKSVASLRSAVASRR